MSNISGWYYDNQLENKLTSVTLHANMKKSLQVLSPFIAAHLQEGTDKIVRKEKKREITMKVLRLSDVTIAK